MSLSNFVLLLSCTSHLQRCSQRQHQPTPTAAPTVSFLTDNIANSSPCSSCPPSYRPWMVIYLLNGTRRCQKDDYGARVPSQFYFDETLQNLSWKHLLYFCFFFFFCFFFSPPTRTHISLKIISISFSLKVEISI